MRRLTVIIAVIFVAVTGLLFSLAPDTLSMLILGIMGLIIAGGYILGIMKSLVYAAEFRGAGKIIGESLDVQTTDTWLAVFKLDNLFRQKDLNGVFRDYKNIVEQQNAEEEILSDLGDYISEEYLTLRTWRGLIVQIPGMLTGLGILGTFIGLLTGLSSVSYSTVEAALESIAMLLAGIETAFFTSIAGVILSIVFNITCRLTWNIMMREYGIFLDTYHKLVIPSSEEQLKRQYTSDMKAIILRLDRLPRNPGYSLANSAGVSANTAGNEQILMPQIVQGLKNDEFTFFLQPVVELGNRKIVKAEALVRWKNSTLGVMTPAAFIPVLEKNGYITRLDMYIWELVCRTIRGWIDAGSRPVPVSINLSKTDIMAMDITEFFAGMLKKYRIPPRALELEIAQNAFVEIGPAINEMAGALRAMGFKVVMDGFNGDYISVNMLKNTEIDAIKLDLRFIPSGEANVLEGIFEQARKIGIEMSAEGIENTEQISRLKSSGCSVGQGFYFHSPVDIDEFEDMMR